MFSQLSAMSLEARQVGNARIFPIPGRLFEFLTALKNRIGSRTIFISESKDNMGEIETSKLVQETANSRWHTFFIVYDNQLLKVWRGIRSLMFVAG